MKSAFNFKSGMSWIASEEGKSASLFLFASVAAGVLNYLFQVIASRNLSPSDFANLNGWLANVSIFFMFGGILQYAAVFIPSRPQLIRLVLIGANLLLLCFLVLWFRGEESLSMSRALMILVLSLGVGWLTGQVQLRSWFGVFSAINVLVASSKVATTFIPLASPESLERYAFALFVPVIITLLIVTKYLWNAKEVVRSDSIPNWTAPILLSIANAVVPQFDLVLMSHTQDAATFSEFVRASMFYRAIYVFAFILAQWLLPRQVGKQSYRIWKAMPTLVSISLLISGLLTLLSPWLAIYLFKWESAPPATLILMSCLNMTLLALLFLYIQEVCTGRDQAAAILVLCGLAIEATVQMTFKFELNLYLKLVVGAQMLLLGWGWFRSRSRQKATDHCTAD